MEHEMKISPSAVRRLRTARGWSQEQLAVASGLSLRTVQRVESEGIASMGTAVSLAATYGIQLIELQEEQSVARPRSPSLGDSAFFLGLGVLTVASLSESGRLPGLPQSDVFAALNLLVAIVGALLVVPVLVRLLGKRKYIGVALAVMGTPLLTLLVAGLTFALVSGRVPTWPLIGMGAAGGALVAMAVRELKRVGKAVGA
jgi:transcriptional regulator with XRE-family HTH domain